MSNESIGVKFAFNDEKYRSSVPSLAPSLESLREAAVRVQPRLESGFKLHYVDEDGDEIVFRNDFDVHEAVRYFTALKPSQPVSLNLVITGTLKEEKPDDKSTFTYIQNEAENFADKVAVAIHADDLMDKIEGLSRTFVSAFSRKSSSESTKSPKPAGDGTAAPPADETKAQSSWAKVRMTVLQSGRSLFGSDNSSASGSNAPQEKEPENEDKIVAKSAEASNETSSVDEAEVVKSTAEETTEETAVEKKENVAEAAAPAGTIPIATSKPPASAEAAQTSPHSARALFNYQRKPSTQTDSNRVDL